jgi:hypothetical protein
MKPEDRDEFLDLLKAHSETQQVPSRKLPGWIDAPGKIAAFMTGIMAIAAMIWGVVGYTSRVASAPSDILQATARIEALEAGQVADSNHHHVEEETFATLARNDSVVLANQEAFKPQVDALDARSLYNFCSRHNRDRERRIEARGGVTLPEDTLPEECQAEWER